MHYVREDRNLDVLTMALTVDHPQFDKQAKSLSTSLTNKEWARKFWKIMFNTPHLLHENWGVGKMEVKIPTTQREIKKSECVIDRASQTNIWITAIPDTTKVHFTETYLTTDGEMPSNDNYVAMSKDIAKIRNIQVPPAQIMINQGIDTVPFVRYKNQYFNNIPIEEPVEDEPKETHRNQIHWRSNTTSPHVKTNSDK